MKKYVMTLSELRRYTRAELRTLHHLIVCELATYPEGSFDQQIALTNLRNIRQVLAIYDAAPH